MNQWIKIVLQILQNIPSIVLDTRDLKVSGDKPYARKFPYTTATADFDVAVTIKNKSNMEKNYKVIVFITDL